MRYAQAAKGYESYGIESDSYEKSDDLGNHFGLVMDEVDYPNPNPQTPMTTGGQGRGPYVNSPDPIEREFDIPVTVIDENVPFELAFGARDEGDGVVTFTEEDVLPTATIEHVQEDLDLVEWFIGCKASLDISASEGEPLEASFSFTAADHDYAEDAGEAADLDVPEQDPFRFNMIGEITLSDGVDSIATPNSVDLSWDNGNEVQHHGQGRDGYAVAETTAAEKYDMSMSMNVTDLDLYKRAAEDDEPVDIEIVFDRDYEWDSLSDAVVIKLNDCTFTDAPIPNADEGVVEADVEFLPTSTEIEIHY
ncbi:phage tail tube protein [Natrarchaeobaculum sulfurireducens]|uniref:Uncharacterized protein n=1 Tax=Natrarchaeobaculum sulfurireducens TaxID=2044521 RepID=A0A346PPP8_9EURY|nr:phage tail tube protein [Natrarchaeobaculum sulfurireducens]AXR81493.1 hypothetical protein AArcMg_1480 [Natrarchaeobaculum sulfurireducens]